jgi:hypothetical protein
MNGRVLILVPSRGRNLALKRMIESVLLTSTQADVAVYIDDDQWETHYRPEHMVTSKLTVGPRMGPVEAMNYLIEVNPGYDVYGAAVDDCTFVSHGWDKWALSAAKSLPNAVGMVAPYNHGSKRMDFPWATEAWIKALGWLAFPKCHHYYWDVLVEDLAKSSGAITYANPEQCTIMHDDAIDPSMGEMLEMDARMVVMWLAFGKDEDMETVYRAMK